jgi:hypothetical protein
LLLADIFINPVYQISFHAPYFVQITIIIMLIYVISLYYPWLCNRILMFNRLVWFVSFIVIIIGLLISNAIFKKSLTFNKQQAELVRIINHFNIMENSLIITNANGLDSAATWIPLITNSHVLFSRDAHFVLPIKQAFTIYLHRLALYIFMMGKDNEWVKNEMRRPYGLFPTTLPLNKVDIEKTISFEEALFKPYFLKIKSGSDVETVKIINDYENIIVIDDAKKPIMSRNNLSQYLNIYSEEKKGSFLILMCKPLLVNTLQ